MKRYNIVISGIGGQGVITLGTLFKLAAMEEGLIVAGSERRGGAQREGHVTALVRYAWMHGDEECDERRTALGPVVPASGADMLIGLEPLEALRVSRYLSRKSTVILNTHPMIPVAVRIGEAEYPSLGPIESKLREFTERVYLFDFNQLSRNVFASSRQANLICFGVAAGIGIPVSIESFSKVLAARPTANEDARGFELGLSLTSELAEKDFRF